MKRILMMTALALGLLAGPVLHAQDTKAPAAPHDTKTVLALDGYCPVAIDGMNKAMKGSPKFTATYKGQTYAFMSEEARGMFLKDPAHYLPKYDGYCATAVAMGQKMKSDPALFSHYKGALYLFSNAMAKEAFAKDPAATVAGADKQWAALTK